MIWCARWSVSVPCLKPGRSRFTKQVAILRRWLRQAAAGLFLPRAQHAITGSGLPSRSASFINRSRCKDRSSVTRRTSQSRTMHAFPETSNFANDTTQSCKSHAAWWDDGSACRRHGSSYSPDAALASWCWCRCASGGLSEFRGILVLVGHLLGHDMGTCQRAVVISSTRMNVQAAPVRRANPVFMTVANRKRAESDAQR